MHWLIDTYPCLLYVSVFACRIPDAYSQRKAVLVLNRLFDLFDKSKAGVVDFREFATGLSIVCSGSRASKVGLLWPLLAGVDGTVKTETLELYFTAFFTVIFDLSLDLQRNISSTPQQLAHAVVQSIRQNPHTSADARSSTGISRSAFQAWYEQGEHLPAHNRSAAKSSRADADDDVFDADILVDDVDSDSDAGRQEEHRAARDDGQDVAVRVQRDYRNANLHSAQTRSAWEDRARVVAPQRTYGGKW